MVSNEHFKWNSPKSRRVEICPFRKRAKDLLHVTAGMMGMGAYCLSGFITGTDKHSTIGTARRDQSISSEHFLCTATMETVYKVTSAGAVYRRVTQLVQLQIKPRLKDEILEKIHIYIYNIILKQILSESNTPVANPFFFKTKIVKRHE